MHSRNTHPRKEQTKPFIGFSFNKSKLLKTARITAWTMAGHKRDEPIRSRKHKRKQNRVQRYGVLKQNRWNPIVGFRVSSDVLTKLQFSEMELASGDIITDLIYGFSLATIGIDSKNKSLISKLL